MFHTLQLRKPTDPILSEMLARRPQLGFGQAEIVYGPQTEDADTRKMFADPIHERATLRAEVVGHPFARGDMLGKSKGFEKFASSEVFKVRIANGDVGAEHGRVDLVAVSAVADEGVDEARGLSRLGILLGCGQWSYLCD